MRFSLFATVFLFYSFVSFSQNNDGGLKITPLTKDFYLFTTYMPYSGNLVSAHGLYILTEEGALLIDSPWNPAYYQALLDSIEIKHDQKAIFCIATHSHEDRTGGINFYKKKGVRTFTSRKTDDISSSTGQARAEYIFEKDTLFDIGGKKFETYFAGEGHTKDNITIWFQNERILYGGCLIRSIDSKGLGYYAEGNVDEWDNTIKRLKRKFKRPNFIIPGHADWTSKKSLNHTLKIIRKHKRKEKRK